MVAGAVPSAPSGAFHLGEINRHPCGQAFQAVVEDLQRVARVMGVGAGVLGDELVVIGRLDEARRPALVGIGAGGFGGIDAAVGVLVYEEVRMVMGVVNDRAFRDP